MDGRVAWDRYEGNDVEAVIATLVNREHPRSIRITPSPGDGGIDILDHKAATDGGDVVYQGTRYAKPLTGGQKTKVLNSFKRLFDEDKRDPSAACSALLMNRRREDIGQRRSQTPPQSVVLTR